MQVSPLHAVPCRARQPPPDGFCLNTQCTQFARALPIELYALAARTGTRTRISSLIRAHQVSVRTLGVEPSFSYFRSRQITVFLDPDTRRAHLHYTYQPLQVSLIVWPGGNRTRDPSHVEMMGFEPTYHCLQNRCFPFRPHPHDGRARPVRASPRGSSC